MQIGLANVPLHFFNEIAGILWGFPAECNGILLISSTSECDISCGMVTHTQWSGGLPDLMLLPSSEIKIPLLMSCIVYSLLGEEGLQHLRRSTHPSGIQTQGVVVWPSVLYTALPGLLEYISYGCEMLCFMSWMDLHCMTDSDIMDVLWS